MKKVVFVGLFAFLLLVQIPFVFSLSKDICKNVSKQYRSDCREIIDLDLADDDKIFLLDNLEPSYSVFDSQVYSGLFSNIAPVLVNEDNYNPKENLKGKFGLILNLIFLFLLTYLFYIALKNCSGSVKWIAE